MLSTSPDSNNGTKAKQQLVLSYDKNNSHVSTVGIMAVNMRNKRPKKRNPALLYALEDSLPILRYRSPIRIPQTT